MRRCRALAIGPPGTDARMQHSQRFQLGIVSDATTNNGEQGTTPRDGEEVHGRCFQVSNRHTDCRRRAGWPRPVRGSTAVIIVSRRWQQRGLSGRLVRRFPQYCDRIGGGLCRSRNGRLSSQFFFLRSTRVTNVRPRSRRRVHRQQSRHLFRHRHRRVLRPRPLQHQRRRPLPSHNCSSA